MVSGNHQEILEEVIHDFYLFFMDHFLPALSNHPDHLYLIETGNFTKLFYIARQKFIWHLKEKSRNKTANPAGYLYRRLRQTLSGDPLFETKQSANQAFLYRIKPDDSTTSPPKRNENPEKIVPTVFKDENFSSWPLLPMQTNSPEKEIFTANFLKNSARIFWNEACARTEVSFLVLNDLSRYILSCHPWLYQPIITDQQPESGSKNDLESEMDAIFFLESIEILARQLISTWSKNQCAIFMLRHQYPQISVNAIAEQLDQPDHNKVRRELSFCRKSFQEFTTNWPGPPLSELPSTCKEIFLEKIVKECKKQQNRP